MVDSLEKVLQSSDANNQKPNFAKKLQRSELPLDVNDILAIDSEVASLESNCLKKFIKPAKIKCCPTFLGIADFSKGRGCSVSPRICSALHCRNCDFSVNRFPNHEWSERVEYLFLRTNMPNFEKVSQKLIKKNGSVAYACHCVSFSTNKLHYLHEEDLPWFCRGHV